MRLIFIRLVVVVVCAQHWVCNGFPVNGTINRFYSKYRSKYRLKFIILLILMYCPDGRYDDGKFYFDV